MNCEKGDLARVVVGVNRDKLVMVLDDRNCDPGEWRCETLQRMVEYVGWSQTGSTIPAGSIVYCMDYGLRPIRDPGDDAQDETLSWLPVPTTEGVPA